MNKLSSLSLGTTACAPALDHLGGPPLEKLQFINVFLFVIMPQSGCRPSLGGGEEGNPFPHLHARAAQSLLVPVAAVVPSGLCPSLAISLPGVFPVQQVPRFCDGKELLFYRHWGERHLPSVG